MWEQLHQRPQQAEATWPPAPDTASSFLSPAWLASSWGKGTGVEVRVKSSFFFLARVPPGARSLGFLIPNTGIQGRGVVRVTT